MQANLKKKLIYSGKAGGSASTGRQERGPEGGAVARAQGAGEGAEGRRRCLPGRVHRKPRARGIGVVDRVEAEAGREAAPLVVVGERPVQVPEHVDALLRGPQALVDVGADEVRA